MFVVVAVVGMYEREKQQKKLISYAGVVAGDTARIR
jgi:hypothetical protein